MRAHVFFFLSFLPLIHYEFAASDTFWAQYTRPTSSGVGEVFGSSDAKAQGRAAELLVPS